MKFFSLIDKNKSIHLADGKKVIPKEEFSLLIEGSELIETIKKEQIEELKKQQKEAEELKEQSRTSGFEEGLEKWNAQLALLEKEILSVRQEVMHSIVPLALTAVKKIIGRELKSNPETVVDIVATALKPVSQHRKIKIYVNRADLELVEAERPRIKELFQHLETLSIGVRDDVTAGGCIIETEAGIINAQLDSQMRALEGAFLSFFQNRPKQENGHA